MIQPLEKYFPLTIQLLSRQEKLHLDVQFFKDFALPKDIRYIPMLAKQLRLREEIVQTADYEYLRYWVEHSEEVPQKLQGKYRLNSTLQWIVLESAAPGLGKVPGLYALWKYQGVIMERKLSEAEAKLISDLHEHPELVTAEAQDPVVLALQAVGVLEVS